MSHSATYEQNRKKDIVHSIIQWLVLFVILLMLIGTNI